MNTASIRRFPGPRGVADSAELHSPVNRAMDTPESGIDFDLSQQQREILHWLVLGVSNKHIADTFHMTTNQVKFRIKVIFRKLNVSNRSQAAVKALRYLTFPPGASS